MLKRNLLLLLVLVASSCSRMPEQSRLQTETAPQQVKQIAMTSVDPTMQPRLNGFASLPDRGELVAYSHQAIRQQGAYTWHRADVSEAYALRAIAQGRLRVATPEGRILDVQYDRHVEHPSGDWTWIGHLPGDEGAQTILTFGDKAAFGSIAQPDGRPPLRLTVYAGASWLVETDPGKLAGLANGGAPLRPDFHVVPLSQLPRSGQGPLAAGDGSKVGVGTSGAAVATASAQGTPTVDLLIGYTSGFVAALGGTSAALTRINYLVDVTNIAYANSGIGAQVRLVKAMQVDYTDRNSNDTALKEISGYDADAQKEVPPAAAFNTLRAARETYGADLVSLVRDFQTPENAGCGIAWLLGGSLQGIDPGQGWDQLGYSVVSDGVDMDETDGKNYYCLDETLAHELGHNMGAAHDKVTAQGDKATLVDPDDYGAYRYSFGYKVSDATRNFYTIMAYGDSGQRLYRTFSNPGSNFCGGNACGDSSTDNTRTLNQTIPVVSGFRGTVVENPADVPVLLRQVDVDGNGRSDLLFFNHDLNRVSYWYMDGATRLAASSVLLNGKYHLADTGDMDNDGRTDLLFTSASRDLVVGLSGPSGYVFHVLPYSYSTSQVVLALADVNGDRRADIVLRDTSTGRLSLWYMDGITRAAYNAVSMSPALTFIGHGDMNNNHRHDLLWVDAQRNVLVSLSTGIGYDTMPIGLAYKSDYQVAGLQDINGDYRDDILLYNPGTNRLVVWYMDGANRLAYNTHVTPSGYRPVAKGNFNGDRLGDIVLENQATSKMQMMLSTGFAFNTVPVPLTPQSGSWLMDVP